MNKGVRTGADHNCEYKPPQYDAPVGADRTGLLARPRIELSRRHLNEPCLLIDFSVSMRAFSQPAWLNGMSALVPNVASFVVGANRQHSAGPCDQPLDRRTGPAAGSMRRSRTLPFWAEVTLPGFHHFLSHLALPEESAVFLKVPEVLVCLRQ
jgi:hypothetical protein